MREERPPAAGRPVALAAMVDERGAQARTHDTGAVYRASGWTRVGTTQGRGRYDRHKQYDKPRKDVWLRPLRKDWKRTLNR